MGLVPAASGFSICGDFYRGSITLKAFPFLSPDWCVDSYSWVLDMQPSVGHPQGVGGVSLPIHLGGHSPAESLAMELPLLAGNGSSIDLPFFRCGLRPKSQVCPSSYVVVCPSSVG